MKKDLEKQKRWRRELNEGLLSGQLEIPTALKLLRKMLAKNQVEYSKFVGVSTKIIAEIEIGKGNPTLKTLNTIFAPIGFRVGLVPRQK